MNQQGAQNSSPVINSMREFPDLPKRDLSYSEVLQSEKERWDTVTNKKKSPKVTLVGHRSPFQGNKQRSGNKQMSESYNSPRSLRGVKPERSTTLYVKNIARNEDEADDAIKEKVRKYIKSKNPVRTISVQVVHNIFCEDMVGCKRAIPISAQEVLMTTGFWPQEVECREWSRRRTRDNQRNRWGSNNDCERDYNRGYSRDNGGRGYWYEENDRKNYRDDRERDSYTDYIDSINTNRYYSLVDCNLVL